MIRIIFMGTSDFAVPSLEKLINNKSYEIVGVFTQPDKPVGRKQELTPSPVKKLAQVNNLPIFQPETLKNKEAEEQIKKLNPDVIIVIAYGQIIPQNILDIPKFQTLNIHGSLLPKYRGASPIQSAILNCEKETGVTIMLLDKKMDHGPVLTQETEAINSNDTYETLHEKLANLGVELLEETLPKWFSGKITPQEQNHDEATYTKIITREDGKINWKNTAEKIDCQIRAFDPWPGTFTLWKGKRLKIKKARILDPNIGCVESDIGKTFKTAGDELAINCGQGSLVLETVQLEGKKETSGEEFIKGYPEILNSSLLDK